MSISTDLSKPYRIDHGRKFRLKDFDPGDTGRMKSRKRGELALPVGVKLLSDLQDKLYAQDRWALLLIFQAMDAAGKDSAIKHVMSGVNPQGCEVFSFKQPSAEELDHDFLWRTTKCLPERGRIGIFNRSYYEEVLVVRVHKELLERQRISPSLVTKNIWNERFADINRVRALSDAQRRGHPEIFPEPLARRAEEALHGAARRSEQELEVLEHRRDRARTMGRYMAAYEEMIQHTATPHAPWYVVPADNKWFTRLVVAAAIADALEELKLAYPMVDAAKRRELKAARAALEREGRG